MSVEDTWSWPEGRLDGRAAFQETLRAALAAAGPQPGAELLLADDDFLDWPLGEALVVASLQRWCQGGGTVLLLARRFDEAMRQHPRLVRWRALWSHRVQARQVGRASDVSVPSSLLLPHWALERLDPDQSLCLAAAGLARRHLRERFLRTWERATPGFPSSVMGL